jgi:hypothetical protein
MGLEPPMKDEFCDREIVPLFLSWTVAVSRRHGRRPAQGDLLARNLDGAQGGGFGRPFCSCVGQSLTKSPT